MQKSAASKNAFIAKSPFTITCIMVLTTLLSPSAMAIFKEDFAASNYGILRVHGTLTESACRLVMLSADQTVNLGHLSTANLKNVGDQGALVAVSLILHDCIRTSSTESTEKDNVAWSAHQPAVSFTFTGTQDPSNPQLVEVRGASGIALRLKDASKNNVEIGQKGKSLRLTPDNAVMYYITAERTRGELRGGTYSANINFRLNYE